MTPEEEKENDDRLKVADNLMKGIELLEKSGIDMGIIKDQLKGAVKLGQTIKEFANSNKPKR